jgi:hypothetical protein
MQVRRKLIGAMGTAAAALTMIVTLSTAAQADTAFGPVAARNSGHCLDVRQQDNYFAPGARVQQWDCSGAPEQQWSFRPYTAVQMPGNPGVLIELYQITSQRSGMCMTADAGGVHALIRQNPCGSGPIANQLWWSPRVFSAPGFYVNLRPWSSTSLCADIQGASDGNGAFLQLFNCTGNTNQQFTGPPVLSS